jgi:hypothetical protein
MDSNELDSRFTIEKPEQDFNLSSSALCSVPECLHLKRGSVISVVPIFQNHLCRVIEEVSISSAHHKGLDSLLNDLAPRKNSNAVCLWALFESVSKDSLEVSIDSSLCYSFLLES